jgi:hypothetical protein
MNLSVSDNLFHFTGIDIERGKKKPDDNAFQTLKDILESGNFRLNRNNRNWAIYADDAPPREMDFDIPMVCFTETPIGFLSNHIEVFGEFGIGMHLEWGIKNGAQNVLYCDSTTTNFYGKTLAGVLEYVHRTLVEGDPQARWFWFRSLVGITENIDFREEREWRILGRTENVPGGGETFEPVSVSFSKKDIVVVVCPSKYISELRTFLDGIDAYKNYQFGLLSSEIILRGRLV